MKKRFKYETVALLCLFSSLMMLSCDRSVPPNGNGNAIVVSIEPLRYFVEKITDGRFPVTVLVPSGVSPETFEPSAQSLKEASQSRLFIATGALDAETNLLQGISETDRLILADSISPITGGHRHRHTATDVPNILRNIDPHIWLSPAEARIITRSITRKLCAIYPDSCEVFRQNCTLLLHKIDTLDRYMSRRFADMPSNCFIIYHPALTYLARQYRLRQIAIEKEGKEPTGNGLKALIDTARLHNIRTLFCQTQLNSQAVQTIAAEINGRVEIIDPLAYDWLRNMYAITDAITGSYR